MKCLLVLAIVFLSLNASPAEAHFGYSHEVCRKAQTRVEVDISTQSLYIFSKGQLIRRVDSNISTAGDRLRFHRGIGKRIIPLEPKGCFQIEGKNRRSFSNAYRVTLQKPVWFGGPGVAEHAYAFHCVLPGKEPFLGRPDSGGCVRTPHNFCDWFYKWAETGVAVWIYGEWQSKYESL